MEKYFLNVQPWNARKMQLKNICITYYFFKKNHVPESFVQFLIEKLFNFHHEFNIPAESLNSVRLQVS